MTTVDRSARLAAEQWFLRSGLPAVLRPGVLVRRVWPRSAPALAAYAVVMMSSVLIVVVTGKTTIDIEGAPTRGEWFVLAIIVLVLPAAALAGWLVSRIGSLRARSTASAVSLAVVIAGGFAGGPTPRLYLDLLIEAIVIATIFLCTATGAGSILGWGVRMTMANLSQTGQLFVRALPVVLLTVLVFFNTYVWLMADIVSRVRMWLAVGFMFLIAAAFLTSSTLDRVRPMLRVEAKSEEDDARLVGTPFEDLPDRPQRVPLSRGERLNVAFVLAFSQIVQVFAVALSTAVIFFVLGLILLTPRLLDAWTRGGSSDGQFLGMTLPVPQSLIQITMFLGALTFMYVSARAVSDKENRTLFLDPLIDDLRLALVARDRYRTSTVAK
ncbi:MAG: hypothetical protein HYZ38_00905 [Mycobacterium sp.]|nr:hypothetical protein [Mycobacterium sp.]